MAARQDRRSRQGRGRLNSVELLPEHADEAVQWALEALSDRALPATAILDEFNARLAALDPACGPISKSAFNRFGLRFAAQARRLREAREAAAALAERLDDMPAGDVGLMLGETIKALINDVLLDHMVDGTSPTMKDLREAADAVYRLENARKNNAEVAEKARAAVMKTAARAVEEAGALRGLTAETVNAIKAGILGVAG